jgi:hypothetical protein
MQEQLDKEDEDDDATVVDETNGETHHEQPHHRHNLLKDNDVELMYLEKHLSQLHKAFYDEYDSALVNAQGGRVAQLKPGHNKKVSIKEDSADLKIVPDIGYVMPRLKYVSAFLSQRLESQCTLTILCWPQWSNRNVEYPVIHILTSLKHHLSIEIRLIL